jgi:hypothetical protein
MYSSERALSAMNFGERLHSLHIYIVLVDALALQTFYYHVQLKVVPRLTTAFKVVFGARVQQYFLHVRTMHAQDPLSKLLIAPAALLQELSRFLSIMIPSINTYSCFD